MVIDVGCLSQSSGIVVNDEVIQRYNELKTGRKYKYVFFKMNDDLTEIVVEKTGPEHATYEEFINELKAVAIDDCRYAVFDFEWDTSDGGKRQKICFYAWYVCVHALGIFCSFPFAGARIPPSLRRRWSTPPRRTTSARSSSVSVLRSRALTSARSRTRLSSTRSRRALATSKNFCLS